MRLTTRIEKKQIGIYSQEAGVVTVVSFCRFFFIYIYIYIYIICIYMYIYNSILTSVYNYRSVHLRNINGHEQWGREGRVHTKCFLFFFFLFFRTLEKRHVDSSNITRRVARCSRFSLFLFLLFFNFLLSSLLVLELVLVCQDTRAQQDSIPGGEKKKKRKNGNVSDLPKRIK